MKWRVRIFIVFDVDLSDTDLFHSFNFNVDRKFSSVASYRIVYSD